MSSIVPGSEALTRLREGNRRFVANVRMTAVPQQLGKEVVIAEGVKAGDRVIIEIPQALEPGATVRLAGEGKGAGDGSQGKGKGKGKGAAKGDSTSEGKAP